MRDSFIPLVCMVAYLAVAMSGAITNAIDDIFLGAVALAGAIVIIASAYFAAGRMHGQADLRPREELLLVGILLSLAVAATLVASIRFISVVNVAMVVSAAQAGRLMARTQGSGRG